METSYGYPGYLEHKAKHEMMSEKVYLFLDKSNDTKGFFEFNAFLKKWLNQHILGTDKMYSEFLNRAGVK
jgi:hemerythrin